MLYVSFLWDSEGDDLEHKKKMLNAIYICVHSTKACK